MGPYFTINHKTQTMEIRVLDFIEYNIETIQSALNSCTKPYEIRIAINLADFGDTVKKICKLINVQSPIYLQITNVLLHVNNLNAIADILDNKNYLVKGLTLGSNRIDYTGISILCRALTQAHYIEHLSIPQIVLTRHF